MSGRTRAVPPFGAAILFMAEARNLRPEGSFWMASPRSGAQPTRSFQELGRTLHPHMRPGALTHDRAALAGSPTPPLVRSGIGYIWVTGLGLLIRTASPRLHGGVAGAGVEHCPPVEGADCGHVHGVGGLVHVDVIGRCAHVDRRRLGGRAGSTGRWPGRCSTSASAGTR
jgi:hypothetical protein